jgi:hypothetical protein
VPKPIATKNLKFMGKGAPSKVSPRYNEMWKRPSGASISNISEEGSSTIKAQQNVSSSVKA